MPGRAAADPSPLRALLWPFRGTVLLLVALLAPLYALAPAGGVIGLFLLYFLGSITCRYADVLLGQALQGESEPTPLALEHLEPFRLRASVALLFLGGAVLLAGFGGATGRFIACGLLALLPLLLSLLHIDSDGTRAWNPLRWLAALVALGPWYPIVLGTGAAGGLLLALAAAAGVPRVLLDAGALLLLFGVMALAGAACHARRFELGHEPVHSSERAAARARDGRARERALFIDRLYAPLRNGKRKEGLALLAARLADLDPRWLDEEAEDVLEAAAGWNMPALLQVLGEQLLAHQLRCGHVEGALATAQRLAHADPAWRPAGAAARSELARLADEDGRPALARQLRDGD